MEKEQKELMGLIYKIMWYMRGMGRDDAWSLSPEEREIILNDVKERVETVEKTGLPLL